MHKFPPIVRAPAIPTARRRPVGTRFVHLQIVNAQIFPYGTRSGTTRRTLALCINRMTMHNFPPPLSKVRNPALPIARSWPVRTRFVHLHNDDANPPSNRHYQYRRTYRTAILPTCRRPVGTRFVHLPKVNVQIFPVTDIHAPALPIARHADCR